MGQKGKQTGKALCLLPSFLWVCNCSWQLQLTCCSSKANKIKSRYHILRHRRMSGSLVWPGENTNRLNHSQATPGREEMDAWGNFKGKVMSVRKTMVSTERDPLLSSHLEKSTVTSGVAAAWPPLMNPPKSACRISLLLAK